MRLREIFRRVRAAVLGSAQRVTERDVFRVYGLCWFCRGRGLVGHFYRETPDGEERVPGGVCPRCSGSGERRDTPEGRRE